MRRSVTREMNYGERGILTWFLLGAKHGGLITNDPKSMSEFKRALLLLAVAKETYFEFPAPAPESDGGYFSFMGGRLPLILLGDNWGS